MKSILVLNQNYIGDVVFTMPAIRSLKEGYPQSSIDVLVGRTPLEILKGNPYISSLIPRPRTFREKKIFLQRTKKRNYEICLSLSTRSVELAIFSLLSRCKKRFGFFNPPTFPFYNFRLKENLDDHSAMDYLKLAIAAGGKKVPIIPEIFLSEEEIQKSKDILKTFGIGKGEIIFGILLGGSTSFKRWHPSILKELLLKLERKGKVLLLGGEVFKGFGEALAKGIKNIYNLAGNLSLREALVILKSCNVFIGQDSGLTHIAAALGVPTIGLYGVTDPKRTAPLGERVKVIYKPPPCGPCWGKKRCSNPLCIQMISAEDIMERIEEFFGKE